MGIFRQTRSDGVGMNEYICICVYIYIFVYMIMNMNIPERWNLDLICGRVVEREGKERLRRVDKEQTRERFSCRVQQNKQDPTEKFDNHF